MELPILDWYDEIQLIQRVMNWVIVSILVVYNIAVLFLLKFQIDLWGLFTIALHLVVSCLRLFTPSYTDQFQDEDIVRTT